MMARDGDDLDGQAAVWLERMNRPVLDSEIAASFDRWIARDPRHAESYARMASLWQADSLALALESAVPRNDNDLEGDAASPPCPAIARRRRDGSPWRRPRSLVAVVAAVLALASAVPVIQGLLVPATDYAAPRGEDRVIDLADGSRIHLNGGTRLSVSITPWSRHVAMTQGEAYFDVAHETLRGFTVDTGRARVAVLGTAFDVNMMRGGEREVRVYRGTVNVEAGNGEWRIPAGSGIALSGSHMRSLDDVEGDRPGWIDGWFDAQDAGLDLLVERMNRTSDRPIVLADPALGTLQVSGRFRLERPHEMLDTLSAIHGLTWKEEGNRLIISRK